jgi:diguanylate cyclase (GGDEF)-like protein
MRSVVREDDLVARLGGDEFAVLCTAVEETGSLVRLAERLTAAVRNPITVSDQQVQVGASVGIAYAAPGTCSIDILLDAADDALYSVKASNRGQWRMADPVVEK